MLVLLFTFLQEHVHTGFGAFLYQSTRGIMAVLTALFLSLFLGPVMIAKLKQLQIGQVVRAEGVKEHLSKSGTPTMGGVLILSSIIISALLWANLENKYIWVVIIVTILFGAIGWVDDYRKVVEKNTKGLPSRWKYFWQSVFALAVGIFLYMTASESALDLSMYLPFLKPGAYPLGVLADSRDLALYLPFLKHGVYPLGVFFIIFAYFVIVGTSNAVNLTDGLDGLAIMPTVLVGAGLGVFCYLSGNVQFANYLLIPYVHGSGELVIFCAAMIGAGLGFLWFNTYPAQVFMGDVGSLALGAALGTMAVIVHQEIVLFIMGGVFVMETLSVIIQVASFKLTGKRVFRMAPIHHHFELKGWPEPRVIVRFWIITVILVLIGLATLKIR